MTPLLCCEYRLQVSSVSTVQKTQLLIPDLLHITCSKWKSAETEGHKHCDVRSASVSACTDAPLTFYTLRKKEQSSRNAGDFVHHVVDYRFIHSL